MRCIVDISRVDPKYSGNYQLRVLRLASGQWDERVELLATQEVLSRRIANFGLSLNRLNMALIELRDEERIVWFDCEVGESQFEC